MTRRIVPPVREDRTTARDGILAPDDRAAFRTAVLTHYRKHGRDLPWRRTADPYEILVSEIMLQQTQVARVADKWAPFIHVFPDFASLARAPLAEVLAVWKGLGYNRRALYLKEIARIVIERHAGILPESAGELVKLPGIGKNTAGAIVAFAFNRPAVFIETNIRSVFIHHFFSDSSNIPDTEILPLVEETLDRKNPRRWYWALMDYGSTIKESTENPNRRSTHYTRHPPFIGSDRQIRGAILGLLVEAAGHRLTDSQIVGALPMDDTRVRRIIRALLAEGFIVQEDEHYRIAG